jgi:hypothetical protein
MIFVNLFLSCLLASLTTLEMFPSRVSIFVCALIVALSACDLTFAQCTSGEPKKPSTGLTPP